MKTKLKLPIILLVAALATLSYGCSDKAPKKFNIAFYNVENLFDTINDEGVRDEGFTPQSAINWDSEKYFKKLNDIARVLSVIDSTNLPVIVGLAEVENQGVLNDLVSKTKLKGGKYSIVHFESPDERGIDVALLYRGQYFTPIHSKPHPLSFDFDKEDKTRDMLYFKGIIANHDTLHIMVDHWPSRSGGQEKSDPKRRAAAANVKRVSDSILRINPNANIIIMGDFNDNPDNASMQEILKAKPLHSKISKGNLYNLALKKFENGEGTLYWKSWDLFDQIIVSGNVIEGNNQYKLNPHDIQIVKEDWMLFARKDGVKVPNRTAGRNDYYGGYSDHLPVYISFER